MGSLQLRGLRAQADTKRTRPPLSGNQQPKFHQASWSEGKQEVGTRAQPTHICDGDQGFCGPWGSPPYTQQQSPPRASHLT